MGLFPEKKILKVQKSRRWVKHKTKGHLNTF